MDDGLAILKNTSRREAEKVKKKFQKIFEEEGLDIIIYWTWTLLIT